jgi:hypothetical protein
VLLLHCRQSVKDAVSGALGAVQERVQNAAASAAASVERSRSIWAADDTEAASSGKPRRPTTNRGVVLSGTRQVEIKDLGYPTMTMPKGEPVEHGVILKVIATNICGSDLHMYRHHIGGASKGMALGHEVTGEIVEMGRDVERWNLGDIVSVPFNVACGKCGTSECEN